MKDRLDARLGADFEPWVFHDFRRSFVDVCVSEKVDPVIADRALNHAASQTQTGIMARYARDPQIDRQREAFLVFEARVVEATGFADFDTSQNPFIRDNAVIKFPERNV